MCRWVNVKFCFVHGWTLVIMQICIFPSSSHQSASVNCASLFLSNAQVFDLTEVKPSEFVEYGLACLEKYASIGDNCARVIRDKLRVVVYFLFSTINYWLLFAHKCSSGVFMLWLL